MDGRCCGWQAAHPRLLGIGLDEGTALVVRGGRGTVVGASYISFFASRSYLDAAANAAANAAAVAGRRGGGAAATPWHAAGGPFFMLRHGAVIDLRSRQVLRAV